MKKSLPSHSPVLALSRGGLQQTRARDLSELEDNELASLVRHRWALSRAQGWALMSTFGVIFGTGVGLAAATTQGWLLGGFIALVLSLSLGLSFAVEAGMWRAFWKRCQSYRLSEEASRGLYRRAAEADAWVEVLRACDREPSDDQIATFVRPHPRHFPETLSASLTPSTELVVNKV